MAAGSGISNTAGNHPDNTSGSDTHLNPDGTPTSDGVTADTTSTDYGSWSWKQIQIAIIGAVDADTATLQQYQLETSDPATFWNAATAFQSVLDSLTMVSTTLHNSLGVLVGPNGVWTGDAANSFSDLVYKFLDVVDGRVATLAGPPAYPDTLNSQGDTLLWAIGRIYQINYTAAQLAQNAGATTTSDNGTTVVTVSQFPDIVENDLNVPMRSVIASLAGDYITAQLNLTPPQTDAYPGSTGTGPPNTGGPGVTITIPGLGGNQDQNQNQNPGSPNTPGAGPGSPKGNTPAPKAPPAPKQAKPSPIPLDLKLTMPDTTPPNPGGTRLTVPAVTLPSYPAYRFPGFADLLSSAAPADPAAVSEAALADEALGRELSDLKAQVPTVGAAEDAQAGQYAAQEEAAMADQAAQGRAVGGYPLGGMGAPGAAAGGPEDRDRHTWLVEDEEVWGADPAAAPAALGR
jgi:hypothetical protein